MIHVTNFREVAITGRKRAACKVCGKKVNRQRKFWQTINPWNVNIDGTQKSRRDIEKELREEICEWKSTPISDHCKEPKQ